MKQLFAISILSIFFVACKKDQAADIRSNIAGEWELFRNFGYGVPYATQPPGNGKIIVFGKAGSFQRKVHDSVAFSGVYKLEYRKDCYGNDKSVFLTTNDTDATFTINYAVSVEDGKLILSTPNCWADGGGSIWRKL